MKPRNQNIINVGIAFDKLTSDKDKEAAVTMLLTDFLVSNFAPDNHSDVMRDIVSSTMCCVREYLETRCTSLASMRPRGNA